MNMSHKGRALSISEKQMVVHVKHYFDKEKELFLTNKKLDVNNSAFRTALATNLSQVTVWRIMAEYNSNDSFSPPVKKGSRTYAINENVKTICQDIIRSHNICRKHLSLRLLVGILHDEHEIVVARETLRRCLAVAQKSPCERNRVIMGQISPLKLGQRGPDARQEVPMRTPKRLYAHERVIYQPELLTCPHCGDLLVLCNYLAWDKTVQMLDRILSVASRPGCCRHATCAGSRMRLLSAEGQRIALPGSTYGYDVLVRIGWWRQEYRATYREIHADLATQVRISVSHVGYLYQQVYLPLLACHERQHRDHLAQIAQQQGGLIVALDGLAPQGGEPQIWFIRELSSGLTLRR